MMAIINNKDYLGSSEDALSLIKHFYTYYVARTDEISYGFAGTHVGTVSIFKYQMLSAPAMLGCKYTLIFLISHK